MFKSVFKIGVIAAAAIAMVGCSRVETGSVGIRIDMSKQVQSGELLPGSWNQTVIGDRAVRVLAGVEGGSTP